METEILEPEESGCTRSQAYRCRVGPSAPQALSRLQDRARWHALRLPVVTEGMGLRNSAFTGPSSGHALALEAGPGVRVHPPPPRVLPSAPGQLASRQCGQQDGDAGRGRAGSPGSLAQLAPQPNQQAGERLCFPNALLEAPSLVLERSWAGPQEGCWRRLDGAELASTRLAVPVESL